MTATRSATHRPRNDPRRAGALPKAPTGILGFDEVTEGGLPRGRSILVCGGPGSGKTLFAVEFVARGAAQMNEPGLFVSFEESPDDLAKNVASIGFDLRGLVAAGKLRIDHVKVERSEFEATGEFDLDGLFIRLGHAIDAIGAKRVALDTLESLFTGLPNPLIIRAELRRLFRWLNERGVTTIITAEKGEGTLTREGLEEYVSDCVIVLDQRIDREVVTRRLHILKYRGSGHASNEFPFLIGKSGISIIPITAAKLDHSAPTERISSGVEGLDEMLGGKGFYRGSAILVSGTAGTGKSTLAAHFVDAACRRGERAVYFSFEESPQTLVRDLKSVGIDLAPWMKKGLLRFHCERVTATGLEMHVARAAEVVRAFRPRVAVVDPISAFDAVAEPREAKNMATLLSDVMRDAGVTTMMTHLAHGGGAPEVTVAGLSSNVDAWVLLRDIESNGERDRAIHILKARGLTNSNQLREYRLTDHGLRLEPPYTGSGAVSTGSARAVLEARERAEEVARRAEADSLHARLARMRAVFERDLAALRSAYEADQADLRRALLQVESEGERSEEGRREMARRRGGRNGPAKEGRP